jgi:hypothetical protein
MKKIAIGHGADGAVELDLMKLVDTRLLVQANSVAAVNQERCG